MLKTRVIPVLLLQNRGLVKGVQFKNHKYVGDPINAVRIFNEKEVDELVFLDISVGIEKKDINYDLIEDIASEAFMPFAYGGGINNIDQVKKLFRIGVEKVIINSAAFLDDGFIREAVQIVGSQSIVVSVDVKKSFLGKYEVFIKNGRVRTGYNPLEYVLKMQDLGVGEIILNSIDKEGTGTGFDLGLTEKICSHLDIPVIASGGAKSLVDLKSAVKSGASAVAAGSMFVFHGKHKAVLITYPKYNELNLLFEDI